jgi:hypothetical protein
MNAIFKHEFFSALLFRLYKKLTVERIAELKMIYVYILQTFQDMKYMHVAIFLNLRVLLLFLLTYLREKHS